MTSAWHLTDFIMLNEPSSCVKLKSLAVLRLLPTNNDPFSQLNHRADNVCPVMERYQVASRLSGVGKALACHRFAWHLCCMAFYTVPRVVCQQSLDFTRPSSAPHPCDQRADARAIGSDRKLTWQTHGKTARSEQEVRTHDGITSFRNE